MLIVSYYLKCKNDYASRNILNLSAYSYYKRKFHKAATQSDGTAIAVSLLTIKSLFNCMILKTEAHKFYPLLVTSTYKTRSSLLDTKRL